MSDAHFAGDTLLLAQMPAESVLVALTNSGPAGQRALRDVVGRPIQWIA